MKRTTFPAETESLSKDAAGERTVTGLRSEDREVRRSGQEGYIYIQMPPPENCGRKWWRVVERLTPPLAMATKAQRRSTTTFSGFFFGLLKLQLAVLLANLEVSIAPFYRHSSVGRRLMLRTPEAR
jgi:hypothetical protein